MTSIFWNSIKPYFKDTGLSRSKLDELMDSFELTETHSHVNFIDIRKVKTLKIKKKVSESKVANLKKKNLLPGSLCWAKEQKISKRAGKQREKQPYWPCIVLQKSDLNFALPSPTSVMGTFKIFQYVNLLLS